MSEAVSAPVGVLLVSVGTPKAPTASAVRAYLRQFLMDPRVIDLPTWRRALLVYLLILPLRAGRSAKAYREIWTDRGSPLLAFGRALPRRSVANRRGAP